MALVDYSDSEISDAEEKPIIKVAPHPSKGAFQKVVDGSNPGKIRVSLPRPGSKYDIDGNEPPAKRIRPDGGGFSDFNSFLPPPKRTSKVSTETQGYSKGLAAGVSLKTGCEPGFTREPEQNTDSEQNREDPPWDRTENGGGGLNLPVPKSSETIQKHASEVSLTTKPLTFKPLSVTRKLAKKSKQTDKRSTTNTIYNISTTPKTGETPRPKGSLFSISAEINNPTEPEYNGTYQPLVYGASVEENDTRDEPENLYAATENQAQYSSPSLATAIPITQSLDYIASDLNLSEAERRRLFGRQKGSKNAATSSVTKIINFNTDEEYKHNEELRAAGERVVQNPVRSIAPGKHSLRQLVNAVSSQKDAFEESFAQGKNNRAEAGNRYGW